MSVTTKIDFWTGSIFAAIGGYTFVEALSFDAESSSYPAALSAALLGLSLALLFQTFRNSEAKSICPEEARILLEGPALEIGVWIAWALALWAGLGYIGPSFAAVMFLIIRHCVDRKIRMHIAQAAAVSLGVFMIFFMIFNVPVPELESITELLS